MKCTLARAIMKTKAERQKQFKEHSFWYVEEHNNYTFRLTDYYAKEVLENVSWRAYRAGIIKPEAMKIVMKLHMDDDLSVISTIVYNQIIQFYENH